MIVQKHRPRNDPRARYQVYKGRIVRECARQTSSGFWQPVIYIQLGGGLTDSVQLPVEETFSTPGEAKRCSVEQAKSLIDAGGLDKGRQ
jgi:hypothetical protein